MALSRTRADRRVEDTERVTAPGPRPKEGDRVVMSYRRRRSHQRLHGRQSAGPTYGLVELDSSHPMDVAHAAQVDDQIASRQNHVFSFLVRQAAPRVRRHGPQEPLLLLLRLACRHLFHEWAAMAP
jgi:hypothetical protein